MERARENDKDRGILEETISIISEPSININTIEERNESLEISLALNESMINTNYLK